MTANLNSQYLQTKYGLTDDEIKDFSLIMETYRIRRRLKSDIESEKALLKFKRVAVEALVDMMP